MDFAEVQVERNNLAGAWEAAGRDEVEMVATEVQQLRCGGEASWDLGMTTVLTCSMMGVGLQVESET